MSMFRFRSTAFLLASLLLLFIAADVVAGRTAPAPVEAVMAAMEVAVAAVGAVAGGGSGSSAPTISQFAVEKGFNVPANSA